MTPLDQLWLPILCSSIAVFFLSAVVNMAPLWHKNDFPRREDQDAIMKALAPFTVAPGEYLLPRAMNSEEMRSPEYQQKLKEGPVFLMTVWKYGSTPMAMTFIYWFFYTTVISLFSAYIAGRALPAGAEYLAVFRYAGTTAFLGYTAAIWQFTIWFNKPLKSSLKMSFDGVLYALCTAGMFGWLWPA